MAPCLSWFSLIKRINLVKVIIDEFHSLVNQHYNIEEGIVYSIRPLSDMEHQDIEAAISTMLESTVVLRIILIPFWSLGLRWLWMMCEWWFHAGQMAQLKAELLKESGDDMQLRPEEISSLIKDRIKHCEWTTGWWCRLCFKYWWWYCLIAWVK